jgi:glycosyltransferase involved in cell wall biosynthesis
MTVQPPRIDILLATHNGVCFLGEQVRSLLAQTYPHFRILARDDGSTDATAALLADLAARCPGKIEILDSTVGQVGNLPHENRGGRRLGSRGNFAALLEHADADYVMFCDQDDVWLPEKIERTLRTMQDVERQSGADQPALVHTDLAVVDEALRPLGRSFWEYQHLDVRRGATINRLLIQNVVTGCAAMANRPLVEKALPIPPEAVHHDWWFALVAATFGRVEPVEEATVLYRQHGRNQVGALRWDAAHVVRKAQTLFDRTYLVRNLRDSRRQARTFLERFGPGLPSGQRSAVEAYARLGDCGFLARRWYLARYGFYRTGWIRNLSLFARI